MKFILICLVFAAAAYADNIEAKLKDIIELCDANNERCVDLSGVERLVCCAKEYYGYGHHGYGYGYGYRRHYGRRRRDLGNAEIERDPLSNADNIEAKLKDIIELCDANNERCVDLSGVERLVCCAKEYYGYGHHGYGYGYGYRRHYGRRRRDLGPTKGRPSRMRNM